MQELTPFNQQSARTRLYEVLSIQILGISGSWLSVNDAGADNSIQHRDLLLHGLQRHDVAVVGRIDIDDVVRNFAYRLVDLLHDVQSLAGEGLRDGSECSGNVLVHDGEPHGMLRSVGKFGIRKVHAVADGAAFEVGADGVGGHGRGGILRLFRGGAQMRQDDGILVIPQEIVGEVGHVPAVAGIQMRLHGFGIHQLATGEVEEDGIRLEVLDHFAADDAVGSILALDVRDVDGDVIRIGDCGGDGVHQFQCTRQSQGGFDGKARVVSLHVHAEVECIASSH
mmetsp:Transcript_2561/g.6954  ORF Transcript_2561/g.6954 Transcript_2561/m.6954 type:complete len:282 (-) Transcript_2561:817-1662(-)